MGPEISEETALNFQVFGSLWKSQKNVIERMVTGDEITIIVLRYRNLVRVNGIAL